MGHWCTRAPTYRCTKIPAPEHYGAGDIFGEYSGWSETPVDVFYVAEPDRSKGHTNYFGMYVRYDISYIIDASSAFSAPITGILTNNGEVIVSRYRHDHVVKDGYIIVGGRDYLKWSSNSLLRFVNVSVEDGEFVFEVQNQNTFFTITQRGKGVEE
jgi:hypothetical protein